MVPGVGVTAVNVDTTLTRSTATDTSGRYMLPAVPPGVYSVTAELFGFGGQTRANVPLLLGQSARVDFSLRLSGVTELITVAATAPVLDARRVAVAFSVGEEQIDGLPINGRNFVNFAALTPGVTTDRTTTRGIIATSGLSFTGQPSRANSLTVDGFDNNDVTTGGVRGLFSQEAIREFQVLTDSYSAEFGRAAGGVVNVVTKSGTNDLHGNAFFYFRNERLNAKEHFEKFDVFGGAIDQAKAPFSQKQWGATLGGPLRKDKTFFFLSYEQSEVQASNFVNIDPAAANVLRGAGFPVELGHVPYGADSSQALVKIDHQWTASDTLTLRGNVSRITNENAEAFGGLVARSRAAGCCAKDWFVSAVQTDILSSRWVSETRVLVSRQDQTIESLDPRCGGPCERDDEGGPEITLRHRLRRPQRHAPRAAGADRIEPPTRSATSGAATS